MFDAIAPTYELINTLSSAGRDRYWRSMMVRLARVRPDDVLVDIACGTGDVARAFARTDANGCRPGAIVGVDFARQMLDRAVQRPIERAAFWQADALRLPLPDRSVSIATCAFGIRNFQNLDAGLAEMHRVLRPTGRAVILEFTVPEHPLLRRLYLLYVMRIMPIAASLVSRDRTGAYRYLPRSVLSFQGREAIVSSLEAAGFDRVSVHPLTGGIVAVYVAGKDA